MQIIWILKNIAWSVNINFIGNYPFSDCEKLTIEVKKVTYANEYCEKLFYKKIIIHFMTQS